MDFISLFTWENWNSERVSSFPTVAWLVSGWGEILYQVGWAPKTSLFHFIDHNLHVIHHIGCINKHDFFGGGEEAFEMQTICLVFSPLGLILSLTSKAFHNLDFTLLIHSHCSPFMPVSLLILHTYHANPGLGRHTLVSHYLYFGSWVIDFLICMRSFSFLVVLTSRKVGRFSGARVMPVIFLYSFHITFCTALSW